MKHKAVSLEERERTLSEAHVSLESEASEWLDARASGHRSRSLDESLDAAIHEVRKAERRYRDTLKRVS